MFERKNKKIEEVATEKITGFLLKMGYEVEPFKKSKNMIRINLVDEENRPLIAYYVVMYLKRFGGVEAGCCFPYSSVNFKNRELFLRCLNYANLKSKFGSVVLNDDNAIFIYCSFATSVADISEEIVRIYLLQCFAIRRYLMSELIDVIDGKITTFSEFKNKIDQKRHLLFFKVKPADEFGDLFLNESHDVIKKVLKRNDYVFEERNNKIIVRFKSRRPEKRNEVIVELSFDDTNNLMRAMCSINNVGFLKDPSLFYEAIMKMNREMSNGAAFAYDEEGHKLFYARYYSIPDSLAKLPDSFYEEAIVRTAQIGDEPLTLLHEVFTGKYSSYSNFEKAFKKLL